MSSNLTNLMKFADSINKLRLVRREVLVNGEDRKENDVEHSYALAMLAWYVIETDGLRLDLGKALRYALIHDLVEIHAGDTYIYGAKEHVASKDERERAAAAKLRGEFPEVPGIHSCIEAYESKENDESRFIYALDKLQPVINIYLDKGRTWSEARVSLAMIFENKDAKIARSPDVKRYWDDLVALLKKSEKGLFAEPATTISRGNS